VGFRTLGEKAPKDIEAAHFDGNLHVTSRFAPRFQTRDWPESLPVMRSSLIHVLVLRCPACVLKQRHGRNSDGLLQPDAEQLSCADAVAVAHLKNALDMDAADFIERQRTPEATFQNGNAIFKMAQKRTRSRPDLQTGAPPLSLQLRNLCVGPEQGVSSFPKRHTWLQLLDLHCETLVKVIG
jgi:hypothetical protein